MVASRQARAAWHSNLALQSKGLSQKQTKEKSAATPKVISRQPKRESSNVAQINALSQGIDSWLIQCRSVPFALASPRAKR
jgi:hypothetical protein